MPQEIAALAPGKVLAESSGGTGVDASDAQVGQVLRGTGTGLELGAVPGGGSVLLQSIYAEYLGSAGLAVVIPADNTIPQNTEGTQIITANITPTTIGNRIRATFRGFAGGNQLNAVATVALFRDAIANALTAAGILINTGGATNHLTMTFEETVASLALRTYAVRAGPSVNLMQFNANNLTTNQLYGGVARATLTLDELTP
jgi:hypothetical protein